MAAFNGNTEDTHNTPHDTVPFQLPPKGKETRKALTAALQFVLSDLQYAQRQEYSKAKHYQEAEHISATLFDLVTAPLGMDMLPEVINNRGLALGVLARHARTQKVPVPKSFVGDIEDIIRTHTISDLQGDTSILETLFECDDNDPFLQDIQTFLANEKMQASGAGPGQTTWDDGPR